jgi:hypothetical protein
VEVAEHGHGHRFGQTEVDFLGNDFDRVPLDIAPVPGADTQPDHTGAESALEEGPPLHRLLASPGLSLGPADGKVPARRMQVRPAGASPRTSVL